jgi:hypothetical protein
MSVVIKINLVLSIPMINRRTFFTSLMASTAMGNMARAQGFDVVTAQDALIFGDGFTLFKALDWIRERGSDDMAASIIQAMRFSRAPANMFAETLTAITGANVGFDWHDWMLWQEQNPQVMPHPLFSEFKRSLYSRIDPNFDDFLQPEYLVPEKMGIRLEEIVWGGVKKDGIPSLDNPRMTIPEAVTYMRDDDLVFGVSINGDTRAYPLRIMGWHEMFNDVIGGVPVALAYCTLCGSGILFETAVEGYNAPFVFGSSGFLYRSNKLMFDRQTNSLWNQFTGKPVVGPLVDLAPELKQHPVVITSWGAWKVQNPLTLVLDLETGYNRDYGSGVVYKDYFASDELMFPVQVNQTVQKAKDYVFGIREFGASKAWPLAAFADSPVINDTIGGKPVVLLGNPETRTVRAYERGEYEFMRDVDGVLKSQGGASWIEGEDGLINATDQVLPRVAGHIAYWFAWDSYLGAQSEVYSDN